MIRPEPKRGRCRVRPRHGRYFDTSIFLTSEPAVTSLPAWQPSSVVPLLWRNWKPVMDWVLGVWEGLKLRGRRGREARPRGDGDELRSGRRAEPPWAPWSPGGGRRRHRRGRAEVTARRLGAVPAAAVATVAAVAPAAGTAPAAFEAQTPTAIWVEAPPAPQVHPLAAFEPPAPAPRPIHVEVHGGPVTVHAAGADAREIAFEVERHYEKMLRPRRGRSRARRGRCLKPSSAGRRFARLGRRARHDDAGPGRVQRGDHGVPAAATGDGVPLADARSRRTLAGAAIHWARPGPDHPRRGRHADLPRFGGFHRGPARARASWTASYRRARARSTASGASPRSRKTNRGCSPTPPRVASLGCCSLSATATMRRAGCRAHWPETLGASATSGE